MNRSTPGLPVHHHLPESTQTHVHCVGDAIQPSHPLSPPSPPALNLSQHQTIGKTIALTICTFVGKEMSLLLNTLSRFAIAFFPRSKCLLTSWLHSPSAGIWEPKKVTVSHCFHWFPIYMPCIHGTRCQDLSFLNVEF